MGFEFSPNNEVVQLCIKGMALEQNNDLETAKSIFFEAFDRASCDFEKYLASYFIAKNKVDTFEKLKKLLATLEIANKIDDIAVKSAVPLIYNNISDCYIELGDLSNSEKYIKLINETVETRVDNGPFYHGTKADLVEGDLLVAGGLSNYQDDLKMNHIYFSALTNISGLAAELANGDGKARVYKVEPTGEFENDPNVTNKKFPGNPTRSYRSKYPLKVICEVNDWKKRTDEELLKWNEKVKNSNKEIIN